MSDVIKCPVCGGDMEEGELMAGIPVGRMTFLWAPTEYFRKHSFNPTLRFKSSIEREGGVMCDLHTDEQMHFKCSKFKGIYYCRKCKKMLVDFGGEIYGNY